MPNNTPCRVLTVEDDSGIRMFLKTTLSANNFEPLVAATGREALEMIASHCPDCVLLDLGLPDMDGTDLIRNVRAWSKVPIIVISARGAEEDKARALDLGADDYLVKPFGMMEMVSRVRAVLRRCAPLGEGSVLRAGNLIVSLDERTVTANGSRVNLTFKEFELLKLFLSHPKMVFTRDQLLANVWNIDYAGETRTVDVHIQTLRQKLGDCGRMIETVRNVGYRLEDGV